ncbi:MAG TPA: hypothetical protein VII37_07605, partial [Candidatus Acidoferrum sp.]
MRLDLPPLFIVQPKQIAPHLSLLRINRDSESATDSASNKLLGFGPSFFPPTGNTQAAFGLMSERSRVLGWLRPRHHPNF